MMPFLDSYDFVSGKSIRQYFIHANHADFANTSHFNCAKFDSDSDFASKPDESEPKTRHHAHCRLIKI